MASKTKGLQRVPTKAFVWCVIAVCFVAGITGDVPKGAVYTDLHKIFKLGDMADLKCQFHGEPVAVFWKKGHDPSTSPNLITWVEGEEDSGSCVIDKTCEMNSNYSLIIKNITISDQGRYICRISNYLGVLIYNFTDITVIASPKEPYPVLDECKEYQGQSCTISTSNAVNVTCTVMNYFPNLDLFFLHGSQKYVTKDTKEWINSDGTKSKSISTEAKPSSTPYTCVAFNIPGSQDQRTATVSVMLSNVYVNTTSRPTTPSINNIGISIIIIVVPVVVVICFAVVIMVIVVLRRQHRGRGRTRNIERSQINDDQEMSPLVSQQLELTGKVSFFELWYLTELLNEDDAAGLLGTLNIDSFTERSSKHKIYEKLCTWKDMNDSPNEAKNLEEALTNAFDPDKEKYQRMWTCLYEKRKSTFNLVEKEHFEHILWHINDRGRVKDFLAELIPGHVSSAVSNAVKMGVIVQSAVNDLMEWSKGPLEANPFVLLSLALEKTKCRSVDRTFFIIPDSLIQPVKATVIYNVAKKLIRRHCMKVDKENTKPYILDGILEETDGVSFDIYTMIMDWLNEQECSNYEKKCKLDDAFIRIGRYDMQDFLGTIRYRHRANTLQEHPHPEAQQFDHESLFDDDIVNFAEYVKYLPREKRMEFCRRIKCNYNEDGSYDKSCLVEKLKEFRNTILKNRTKNEALQEFIALRQEIMNSTMYSENFVTDEETEDIIKLVSATTNVEEFLHKLDSGIDVRQEQVNQLLKAWRNTETMQTSISFSGKNVRDTLRNALREISFGECIVGKAAQKSVYQIELADVAFNLVMKDVLPLIKDLSLKQEKVRKYVNPKPAENKGILCLVLSFAKHKYMERNRSDMCEVLKNVGLIDVARSLHLDYELSLTELINIATDIGNDKMDCFLTHLGFKEEELKGCLDGKGDIDRVKTMVLWKQHIYPVPYPYRNKLVAALRAAEQEELVNGVLSGHHKSREPNPAALHNIFCRLNDEMISKLAGLLQVGTPGNRDIDRLVLLLIDKVTEWMDKFDQNDTGFLSNPMKERKKMNDMLFTNGFYELAKEIMLLERCHQHSS